MLCLACNGPGTLGKKAIRITSREFQWITWSVTRNRFRLNGVPDEAGWLHATAPYWEVHLRQLRRVADVL